MTVRASAMGVASIAVGDEPAAWVAGGFDVHDHTTYLGGTRIELHGQASGRRIRQWSLSGIDPDALDEAPDGTTSLDGLPTLAAPPEVPPGEATTPGSAHPNGTIAIDHVVLLTPDQDRSIAALGAAGLAARRTRHTDTYGTPMVQTFFRAGPTIIELVGPPAPLGDGPAGFFGLALTVADLDATAALLGSHLGEPKQAVQPGRCIATLRHRELDMSVAIAFMSPESDAQPS